MDDFLFYNPEQPDLVDSLRSAVKHLHATISDIYASRSDLSLDSRHGVSRPPPYTHSLLTNSETLRESSPETGPTSPPAAPPQTLCLLRHPKNPAHSPKNPVRPAHKKTPHPSDTGF